MALQTNLKYIQENFGVLKEIKAKKCRLERIRRQRINDKMERLKIAIMKHLGNDVGFYPPMEKADILEMAIRCLEGKENMQVPKTKELKKPPSPQRSPLRSVNNENVEDERRTGNSGDTPTRKIKKENEVTPTRVWNITASLEDQHELCKTPSSSLETTERLTTMKPLLDHPIKTFRTWNCDNNMNTCYIDECKKPSQELSNMSPELCSSSVIWRPWVQ